MRYLLREGAKMHQVVMPTNIDEHCAFKGKIHSGFSCRLNCSNGSSDKYYILQIIERNDKFYLYRRYGANNQTHHQKQITVCSNAQEAENLFVKLFKEKTKNDWYWALEGTFKPAGHYFYY